MAERVAGRKRRDWSRQRRCACRLGAELADMRHQNRKAANKTTHYCAIKPNHDERQPGEKDSEDSEDKPRSSRTDLS